MDLSKWSKGDFSTGLIPDYIDCKYFAGKPVVTNNFLLVFRSVQRKSFTNTFWQPHFSIWRLKKILVASWRLPKKVNFKPCSSSKLKDKQRHHKISLKS